MNEIELYSKQTKQTASDILHKTNLINILEGYGEVFVGGSYKYDLMWGPDIDIVVKCKNPRTASVEALRKLIELRLFQKYEYGDFENFKREDRPESFIVNLRLPYAGQKWEIETWFFRDMPKSQSRTDELIQSKLNEENKKIILEMKKKRDENAKTKHQISSTQIYESVLVDGVKSFEEFISLTEKNSN